jgi:hypothetical protein
VPFERCYAGILLLAFALPLGQPGALAQGASSWVDPPDDLGSIQSQPPVPPTPPVELPLPAEAVPLPLPPARPPAAVSARPDAASPRTGSESLGQRERQAAPAPAPEQTGTIRNALAEKARALAVAYLDTWSAPDEMTLDTMSQFYAATIRFHGRVMSARALLDEKRRFVRRWPERDYAHRPESMEVACDQSSATCTVRSVFDFEAANQRAGRRSEGVAALELVVSQKGERPVIISERSEVLDRSGADRRLDIGGGLDE